MLFTVNHRAYTLMPSGYKRKPPEVGPNMGIKEPTVETPEQRICWAIEEWQMRHRQLKWRQQDLADQLGVSQVTVSRWMTGFKRPSEANWTKLAAALGVRRIWLQFGDGPVYPAPAEPDISPARTRAVDVQRIADEADARAQASLAKRAQASQAKRSRRRRPGGDRTG